MNPTSHFERKVAAVQTKAPNAGLQILLIRPGATVLDEQGRIKGNLDLPLSPLGFRQVERLMQQIGSRELAAIFCATTVCARQTAAALAEQLGARVRIDEDLRNLDHGLWQGKRFDELKQTQPRVYRSWAEHPESVAPPGGETIASAQERVQQFLRRLFRRFKTGTVAIVAAEPLATIVRSAILNQPIDNFWQAERRFGDWETIALKS